MPGSGTAPQLAPMHLRSQACGAVAALSGADLQKVISTRTTLQSQHTENEGVLEVRAG
jgi:hypothetical protein